MKFSTGLYLVLSSLLSYSMVTAQTVGGQGGTSGQFSCNGKAFLTQIMGSLGNVVDSIQFRCSDGQVSQVFGKGDNGAKWELPPVFSGIRLVDIGGSNYVRMIQLNNLQIVGADMSGSTQNFNNPSCPYKQRLSSLW